MSAWSMCFCPMIFIKSGGLVEGDLPDGFHGDESMLVEPLHVRGTTEKFAAGGGVGVLGHRPRAPGPRPKRVAGGVHNGIGQAVYTAKGSAVVDGAGNAGEGGVALVGTFADDGAN